MPDAPRIRRSDRADRPSLIRIVLRTIIVSVVILSIGYGAGLLIGRELL